ncbi:MAG: FAD-dependent oxidoreductase [Candidatus Cryptobacteroides sp.]|nr:FAD-dependent oxidoreductase [Bacteroidales bacterium]
MKKFVIFILLIASVCGCRSQVLIEAEAFSDTGGWQIDQQFMDQMGSPYLLAHGIGTPVADAVTSVKLPSKGKWQVYARTYNWTSPWHSGEGPGCFRIAVNGEELEGNLGISGDRWEWQYAGEITVSQRDITLSLKDISGFDGRCDAVLFCKETPERLPETAEECESLRKKLHKGWNSHKDAGTFDFVVTGAGTAGICAAVSAARLGLKVALIHDRPVLGGNNSSEIRVHLGGVINCGPYPELGNIVKEFGHSKKGNAMPAENYEDWKKDSLISSEPNITLFKGFRATGADMSGNRIKSLTARDIRTGRQLRFKAPLFADCTGDGNVGALAGADFRTGRESREQTGEPGAVEVADSQVMGSSVQWYSVDAGEESPFPVFEYGKVFSEESVQKVRKGEWTWETGMNRDQIAEAERVRDHGLLVVYSNWSWLKNFSSVKEDFSSARLEWVAYIAGKRESRRLLGDIVLTQNDILDNVKYDDASAASSWSIDLHYPDPKNTAFFPGEEFKAVCVQEPIDIYPVPYRCLYSRNITNLFMAGRDISVTHVALGTVRVMRTTAMLGEVVGMAASICSEEECTPRQVYVEHLDRLKDLMREGCGRKGLPDNQKFNLGRKHNH